MAKVAIVRSHHYQVEQVYSHIQEALTLIDYHLPDLTGKIALVKTNLLAAAPPESAVCTHPVVVEALIRILQEAGARVWVGDSPAFDSLQKAASRAGLAGVVERTGAELMDFSEVLQVEVPGQPGKVLPLARPVIEADYLVSAAKLKTHGLTRYTGAVKNLFGAVPGPRKAQFHLKKPDVADFAELLVDIYTTLQPDLALIDGIVGMEGAGPRNGSPKEMGALIVSTDGHSCDAAACAVIGLAPEAVPTLRFATRAGLYNPKALEIYGVGPDELGLTGEVQLPADTRGTLLNLPGFLMSRMQKVLSDKPVLIPELCIGCGICANACPPEVISIQQKKAVFDYTKCIRCYCCQELCPQGAIELKSGWLKRVLNSH